MMTTIPQQQQHHNQQTATTTTTMTIVCLRWLRLVRTAQLTLLWCSRNVLEMYYGVVVVAVCSSYFCFSCHCCFCYFWASYCCFCYNFIFDYLPFWWQSTFTFVSVILLSYSIFIAHYFEGFMIFLVSEEVLEGRGGRRAAEFQSFQKQTNVFQMQFIGVFFRLCQKSFLPPDSMIVAVYHVIESIRRVENTVLPCVEVVKWDNIFI